MDDMFEPKLTDDLKERNDKFRNWVKENCPSVSYSSLHDLDVQGVRNSPDSKSDYHIMKIHGRVYFYYSQHLPVEHLKTKVDLSRFRLNFYRKRLREG